LKVQVDTELKEFTRKQDKVQNQVDELSKDQGLTLQVMDIIERVINHLNIYEKLALGATADFSRPSN
ncbi:MAG: hypothetical protein H0X02_10650, partial [Nitrosomonas sp.]|nr:hypothetical protein [Nitrosomonas sp.]